jgi:hypothetical protein
VIPRDLSSSAARALVASLGQLQNRMISRSRGISCPRAASSSGEIRTAPGMSAGSCSWPLRRSTIKSSSPWLSRCWSSVGVMRAISNCFRKRRRSQNSSCQARGNGSRRSWCQRGWRQSFCEAAGCTAGQNAGPATVCPRASRAVRGPAPETRPGDSRDLSGISAPSTSVRNGRSFGKKAPSRRMPSDRTPTMPPRPVIGTWTSDRIPALRAASESSSADWMTTSPDRKARTAGMFSSAGGS